MNLTHLTSDGTVRMVDITDKEKSDRTAKARGEVEFPDGVLESVLAGDVEKGEVFATARVAGIEGAKRTPETIPMAHLVSLTSVQVDVTPRPEEQIVEITCEARARDATGVEMEALCGVNAAALTLYDMCKGLSKGIRINNLRLLSKSGGTSGDWTAGENENDA